MVLWKFLLASKHKEMSDLSAIKQKGNEEWQQKLKTFEEISQKKKKINYQKSWFPLRKALKNYTKSFGINIIWNKNDPLIQLNSIIDSVAFLLKKQLNGNEWNYTY